MEKLYIVKAYYFSDIDWKGHIELIMCKTKELAHNFVNGITQNDVRTYFKDYLVHSERLEEKPIAEGDRDLNLLRYFETNDEWNEHLSIYVFEAQLLENENDISEQLKRMFFNNYKED